MESNDPLTITDPNNSQTLPAPEALALRPKMLRLVDACFFSWPRLASSRVRTCGATEVNDSSVVVRWVRLQTPVWYHVSVHEGGHSSRMTASCTR